MRARLSGDARADRANAEGIRTNLVQRGRDAQQLEIMGVFVALIGCALLGTAVAQTSTPSADAAASNAQTDKAKQEIVTGTTQTQVKQKSGGGYHGAKPAADARSLTTEEKQRVMSSVAKSAKDNYRPITPPPTAGADNNGGKARPSMTDPEVREAILRNQR